MLQHHSDQLVRIISLRKQLQPVEPYDFIVWGIYCIDVYALLSTTGTGSFIDVFLKQKIVPALERTLIPMGFNQSQIIRTEEQPYFAAIIQLNQQVLFLAARVGQLAQNLRSEKQTMPDYPGFTKSEEGYLLNCRDRIQELRQMINSTRQGWRIQFPEYWTWLSSREYLPPRVIAGVEHVFISPPLSILCAN
jgi:hypothetical protein